MEKHLEVIPAVLSKTREDMMRRISLVSPYVKTIHIDMMDGRFVPNTTLSTDETVKALDPKKKYIFHWMVEMPEKEIPKLGVLAKKSLHLVHAEVLGRERWDVLKKLVVPLGIAVNPETSLAGIEEYIDETDEFLVMAVHPGFSNQKYIPDVENRIRELRRRKPHANIEVDGGVGPETAGRAAAAGANRLAAASAIFGAGNVRKAIMEIKKAAEGGHHACSKK
ncbi:ribulose-phosphate 3-epimerase [Candidatus Micrarchaeota archaeon]|nr:ribulose-phosphate 3-epimerase [Candidatus Micrarchaeota archaeon]